jgi:hypothetical protein
MTYTWFLFSKESKQASGPAQAPLLNGHRRRCRKTVSLRNLGKQLFRQCNRDRQWTYSIILGGVHATTVTVEKQYYILWVYVCSLNYPACNAHVSYRHLWPTPLYHIFPHYLINGTIIENKLLNVKCVLWFSLQYFSETFLILRRIKRDMIKMYTGLLVKCPLFLSNEPWIVSTASWKILTYQT